MTKYALTGVTGHFGGVAVRVLAQLVAPTDIIAIARNVEKAKAIVPAGVEVRAGDYENPATLRQALTGVDRLLLVSSHPSPTMTRERQQLNVVIAAHDVGVKFIAYTSFPHTESAVRPAKIQFVADHRATEDAILATGMAHSFLRNNWYLENEARLIKGALAGDSYIYAAGEGRIGWALEREYAEAAAWVLAMEEPREVYELTGQPRTYQDLAAVIPEDFEIDSVDVDTYQQTLQESGMLPAVATQLALFQQLMRDGDLSEENDDFQAALGHPLTDFGAAVQEVIASDR